MATSATEWQTSIEMTLPSGNVAKLRRVALIDLIVQGGIPDTLSGRAVEMANQTKQRELDKKELLEYEAIVNLVIKACMVEPKVADRAGDGSLSVSEVDFIDRVQIFNWANGSVSSLRPFRGDATGKARTFNAS